MTLVQALWCSVVLFCAACAAPVVEIECGIGERQEAGICVQVPYLQVHFDERQDVTGEGFRQGIGANACFYKRLDQEVLAESAFCQTVRFSGNSSAESLPFSAGGIAVHLPDPFVMNKPDAAECYEAQLASSRDLLYEEQNPFQVEFLGGADFDAFAFALLPPPPMSLLADDVLRLGQDFSISWPKAEPSATHVLAVLRAHDGQADQSVHAVCFFADDGTGVFPASITAPLHDTPDARASLYVLRQNWVHIEPYFSVEFLADESKTPFTLEGFASRSVVDDVLMLKDEP